MDEEMVGTNGQLLGPDDCDMNLQGTCIVDNRPCERPPKERQRACFLLRIKRRDEMYGENTSSLEPSSDDEMEQTLDEIIQHRADINQSRAKLGLPPLH